jgi:hypothetical protein
VFCPILEFRDKKWTFAKIEGGNVNFFLTIIQRPARSALLSLCGGSGEFHRSPRRRLIFRLIPPPLRVCALICFANFGRHVVVAHQLELPTAYTAYLLIASKNLGMVFRKEKTVGLLYIYIYIYSYKISYFVATSIYDNFIY